MRGEYDAIVIGAGPAGSSAAAALAARGHHALLVEQNWLPRHKVCGEFLSPEAQGTLTRLGLSAALRRAQPVALHHVELIAPDGSRLHRPLPGPAWGISRYVMDAALAEAAEAQGATLTTGTTVTRTTFRSGLYTVSLRHATRLCTVTARAVLLAAGRHSRAALTPDSAPALRRPRHGRLRQAVGIKRHYIGLALPPQVGLYLFAGGYAGINPIEEGRANLCMLVEDQTFRAAGGDVNRMFAAAQAANPALADLLAGATPLNHTTRTVAAVDTESPARPWQGLPRLGDAAVMMPPLCGDGMAMALRGAELCVAGADAYLRGECSLDEWEAEYTRAWRAEFASRVRVGRGLQRLLMMPSLTGGLLTLGGQLPFVADYLVRATRGSGAFPFSTPSSHTGYPTA